MTPELKFQITASNRSAATLQAVATEVRNVKSQADLAGTSLMRFGNTTAIANRDLRSTHATLTNLSFQLNDVITGLLSGQQPMRILAQQGGQIVQAFQMAPGGVGGTFKALGALLVRFAPLLAGVAAAAIIAATGIKALGDRVSEGHKKALTFGQTIKGLAVTMWDAFSSQFGKLPPWVSKVWGTIEDIVANGVNKMIQSVASFGAEIDEVMKHIPGLVTDFMVQGVNIGIIALNHMTDALNQMATAAGLIKPMTPDQVQASHIPIVTSTFANQDVKTYQHELAARLAKIQSTNYLDQIYANGTAGDTVKKVTKHLSKQDEVLRGLMRTYDSAKSVFQGMFSSLADNLKQGQNVFQAFANAALDALGKVFDKMLDLATSNLFETLFPKPTSDAGNWATSLFKSLGFAQGGVFSGGRPQAFALGGVVTRPTVFPFANGIGLMGEAGSEAIMPLKRGADGRLGVAATSDGRQASADRSVHVTVGVSVDRNGNLEAYVKNISRDAAATGIRTYDAGLPDRLQQIRRDPRARSR